MGNCCSGSYRYHSCVIRLYALSSMISWDLTPWLSTPTPKITTSDETITIAFYIFEHGTHALAELIATYLRRCPVYTGFIHALQRWD